MEKAKEAVEFYTEMGNEILGTDMPTPFLDFSLRGTMGGAYSPAKHTVKVNLVLLSENFEDYLEQTIPHELAHGFVRHKWGNSYRGRVVRSHGREWKSVMRALGKEPTRCHSYDVDNARVRRVAKQYRYACACQEFELTSIRHNRIRDAKTYSCKRCRQPLKYQGLVTA
jgi:SprT protein